MTGALQRVVGFDPSGGASEERDNVERDSASEVEGCRRQNERLRERLRQEQKQTEALRAKADRWYQSAANLTWALVDANARLNEAQNDLAELSKFNGVQWLRDELACERGKVATLKARRQGWNDLARRATTAKAEEAQRARDLDAVVEELRGKLVKNEQKLEGVISRAEGMVWERDKRERRFLQWCERWQRGEVGAHEVVAGITAELGGHQMEETSVLDRRRAIEHAKTVSIMNEATDQLSAIVRLLAAEGVPFKGTAVELVGDYIARVNGRVAASEGDAEKKRQ
jgi:hypothetical protein